MQQMTVNAMTQLLRLSSDTANPNMRDIFFPMNGLSCAGSDLNSFDFKVDVDGTCWQNVHPDHLNVYSFNYWVGQHPGGPDKITQWANIQDTFTLVFPGWHTMDR
jgi:hypothetical protein